MEGQEHKDTILVNKGKLRFNWKRGLIGACGCLGLTLVQIDRISKSTGFDAGTLLIAFGYVVVAFVWVGWENDAVKSNRDLLVRGFLLPGFLSGLLINQPTKSDSEEYEDPPNKASNVKELGMSFILPAAYAQGADSRRRNSCEEEVVQISSDESSPNIIQQVGKHFHWKGAKSGHFFAIAGRSKKCDVLLDYKKKISEMPFVEPSSIRMVRPKGSSFIYLALGDRASRKRIQKRINMYKEKSNRALQSSVAQSDRKYYKAVSEIEPVSMKSMFE